MGSEMCIRDRIDPWHLEAYGETTVNYNRDIEIFPVLDSIFKGIYGENPYKSPTDMGVNMVGNCIIDDDATREASNMEIIRRYYDALCRLAKNGDNELEVVLNEENELLAFVMYTINDQRYLVDNGGDGYAYRIQLENSHQHNVQSHVNKTGDTKNIHGTGGIAVGAHNGAAEIINQRSRHAQEDDTDITKGVRSYIFRGLHNI